MLGNLTIKFQKINFIQTAFPQECNKFSNVPQKQIKFPQAWNLKTQNK